MLNPKRTLLEYHSAYNQLADVSRDLVGACPTRLRILRSYSCEILEKLIPVDAWSRGYALDVATAPFDQYYQEMIDPAGELHSAKPEAVALLVNAEDVAPSLFQSRFDLHAISDSAIREALSGFFQALDIPLRAWRPHVVVANFTRPRDDFETHYDARSLSGLSNLVRRMNLVLAEHAARTDSLYVLDFDGIIADIGRVGAYDLKMRHIARNPYSFAVYSEVSRRIVDLMAAIRGKRAKCIVLDLDNTLWRGIVGEDGPAGIEINDGFRRFQRQLKYLAHTGVLLAVNSKNNPGDAMAVIENHPDMILRKGDFACLRINWNDKVDNLRDIARELNIGLDSLIFFDDSEYECELVRGTLPMVATVRLNGDYLRYCDVLRDTPGLGFVFLTDEDRNRSAMYLSENARKEVMAGTTDLAAFLAGLGLVVEVAPVDDFSLERAAQLTQKTNQFNLTTKRYDKNELRRRMDAGDCVLAVRVLDKFGDYGIVGLAILERGAEPAAWNLDTFLLSCRVMGRDVERAVFAHIVERAGMAGIAKLYGRYIPTEKNKPVENLLDQFGFSGRADDGMQAYDVSQGCPRPAHIVLKTETAASNGESGG